MENQSEQKPKRSIGLLVLAILIILILVVGWHLLFPALGLTLALTAGALWLVVATISVLCIAIILFFIISGFAALIIGAVVFVLAIFAIGFFPIFFPIIAPLLVILLFIGFLLRRRRNK